MIVYIHTAGGVIQDIEVTNPHNAVVIVYDEDEEKCGEPTPAIYPVGQLEPKEWPDLLQRAVLNSQRRAHKEIA